MEICIQCMAPLRDAKRVSKRYCSDACKMKFHRLKKQVEADDRVWAPLKSPYPYIGGKSTIAQVVWQRFGEVPNFVEPFMGSSAVLLSRPHAPKIETVNDLESLISNFWRALRSDPNAVAYHADYIASEADLHARHADIVRRKASLTERIQGDPHYFDAEVAGWWVWGMALWIGGGFCSGEGPWVQEDGKLIHVSEPTARGVYKPRQHLGSAGEGVQKRRLHLNNAGVGVFKRRIQITNAGQGVQKPSGSIYEWMQQLADRFHRVRICCGDWSRVVTESVTYKHLGITGIFLDPPYGTKANRKRSYWIPGSWHLSMVYTDAIPFHDP